MEINNLYLHPFIRLSFLVGGITGSFLINLPVLLLSFYSLLILPLFILSGQIKKHINLMLFGMLPIFLSFVLLYIVVLKSSNGDWNFIYLKMLKLILFTSIIQLTLSIPSENLISTFKMWRLKGEALITVLGAFTVWADVNYRAGKIITARFSRGFIGKRTVISKAKQFPFVLVPLVIGILRTSTERAESWEQKNILHLVEVSKYPEENYSFLLNRVLLFVSICWLLLGIFHKQIFNV
ncbi:MAG: hypothetical protein ABL870_11205 [Sediminibacterium sp.]